MGYLAQIYKSSDSTIGGTKVSKLELIKKVEEEMNKDKEI